MNVVPFHFWMAVTRLGQAEVLLPLALAMALVLLLNGRAGWAWVVPFAAAVLATLATKIAFIGWGVGIRSLDFTGVSGHAMLAASVYPVLGSMLGSRLPSRSGMRAGAALGVVVAAMVAYSRLVVHAHSPSEAISGFALGVVVSTVCLYLMRGAAHGQARPLSPAVGMAMLAWVLVFPVQAPASTSQEIVIRLALLLSQHDRPYQRADLFRHRPPQQGLQPPASRV
jgi:membrane-associated phospholipid phosphatase